MADRRYGPESDYSIFNPRGLQQEHRGSGSRKRHHSPGSPDEVRWDQPISLLLIDGLHDYANVSRDFFHFEKWVASNAYVAFHDYADYFPGVKAFVDELLRSGQYRKVSLVKSMMVLQKSTSRV